MARMVKEVTVRRVGGSVGTTLPKDMADRLHREPADDLAAFDARAKEPNLDFEDVLKDLKRRGKL